MLLSRDDVLMWVLGDLSFLPAQTKEAEDAWGRSLLKQVRPDLSSSQWTNLIGEYICKELFTRLGHVVTRPVKMCHLAPDLETGDSIIEVKTQTFFTSGTAGEKILGVPFKYADIPTLYGKPLTIVCIAGAEREGRRHGVLGTQSHQKKVFLDTFQQSGITFTSATDILLQLQSFLNQASLS